jgi:hypothetical protein
MPRKSSKKSASTTTIHDAIIAFADNALAPTQKNRRL